MLGHLYFAQPSVGCTDWALCIGRSVNNCCNHATALGEVLLGRTRQVSEEAKGPPGLRSTHGLSCGGCVATCLANASLLAHPKMPQVFPPSWHDLILYSCPELSDRDDQDVPS